MSGERLLVDRIMIAVLHEAPPTPTRAFASAVRHGRVADAVASVSVAWHIGTLRRRAVGPSVRVRSLALVVAVLLSLGSFSIVAGAAARVVVQQAFFGADARSGPEVERPLALEPRRPGGADTVESAAPAEPEPSPSARPGTLKGDEDAVSKPTSSDDDRVDDDRDGPEVDEGSTEGGDDHDSTDPDDPDEEDEEPASDSSGGEEPEVDD